MGFLAPVAVFVILSWISPGWISWHPRGGVPRIQKLNISSADNNSLISCEMFGSPYLVEATGAVRTALSVPSVIVCTVFSFMCPNSRMTASVFRDY